MNNNNALTLTEKRAQIKSLMMGRHNSRMNGQEILEAYRSLHPVTQEPLDITFTAMYEAVLAVCGIESAPVRIGFIIVETV